MCHCKWRRLLSGASFFRRRLYITAKGKESEMAAFRILFVSFLYLFDDTKHVLSSLSFLR
jgi:hypothetical protein